MELREYFLSVARELDKNYLPDSEEKIEEMKVIMGNELYTHYTNNIAPEIAAEFLAFKLGITRIPGKLN